MSIVGTAPRPNGNEEDHTGLLSLAASGLAVGALAGLVASAFHFALDAAERLLAALLAWAHGYPAVGWVAPICTVGPSRPSAIPAPSASTPPTNLIGSTAALMEVACPRITASTC